MRYCQVRSQRSISRFPMKKISIVLLLPFLLAFTVAAQTTPPSPQRPSPSPARLDQEQPQKEHKVTPEEARELFQSVDEILRFASADTLLPVKFPVKKAMVNRAQVEKYIGDKFKDDVDRIRFERSELVLKKFGLLPRKFELHDFLIKLMGEQVAGYYDEKTKTINLLDWVELDMQKAVMAHELTHALQDQSFDLGKMMKEEEEIEKRGPQDPNALIRIDEKSTARTAVMEGQAMIVFVDYLLKPMGHSVEDSPKLLDMMRGELEQNAGGTLFESAPLLLKEELVFPYGAGMKFIRDLLVSGGRKLAFSGVLERMPRTSREILEPQEYLAGRVVPPLLLPDFDFLKKDFEAFDAGAVGELDVSILLKQYADNAVAARLSPEWRGGSYYAAGRKGAKPSDPNSTAHIGLLYVSKWSSDKVAQEFARIYAAALPQRYSKLEHERPEATRPGREKYSSSDGLIFIELCNDLVIAVEGFDPDTADKLIQAARQQAGKDSKLAARAASETRGREMIFYGQASSNGPNWHIAQPGAMILNPRMLETFDQPGFSVYSNGPSPGWWFEHELR
jgi:hypothetical protein